MTDQSLAVTTVVNARSETVFDLLADPSTHPAIDGTGWVRPPIDPAPLTEVGQIFRMGMYHENHPNKHYEMANRVEVLDRPHAIAWQPGAEPKDIPGYQGPPDAGIDYGGWTWRYDLVPAGSGTAVTLTYDWSNVSPHHRDIEFPPFPESHLENSLRNLAALAEQA